MDNKNNCFNKMTFNVSDAQSAHLLSPKRVVMSIKNVEQFVERRKIDGITRYFCQWPNCSYNSRKSNHLVRHITSHSNERKELCNWPGCGKKFSDISKLKDHQMCHKPTSLLSNTMVPDINIPSMPPLSDKSKSMIYTPNPHKFLIQSLSSPPLPTVKLPALTYRPNTQKSKSPVDIVMSIKNVEEYVERRKVNGITFYFCKWEGCSYGSNKSNHLVRHVRSHTGERPYSCDECDKKFTDSWKLKDHKSIHAKKNNQNLINGQKVILYSLLQPKSEQMNHKQNEKINDLFENNSNINETNFEDSNNKLNNEEIDFDENCELEESSENIGDEVESNLVSFDNSDEMADLLVPQVIIDEEEEEEDETIGTDNNERFANQLESSSANQQNIKSVQQLMNDSFAGVLSIKNVEQYVDKVVQPHGHWYVCKWVTGQDSTCGFSTQKSSYITQHVYRHMGERPYKCQWNGCSATFNKKQNLKLHMTCHTGEQTFRCSHPNCYYTGISAQALLLHASKHLQDKSFECKWNGCGLQFATQIDLLKHSKLHSGVRLHSCHFPNCDYASKYRNKLQIHIRRHTNTKPYVCQYDNCGKSFIVKDKLRRHENSVHKEPIQPYLVTGPQMSSFSSVMPLMSDEHQSMIPAIQL